MSDTDVSIKWYALQVRPRNEDVVASTLTYKGYENYVPAYLDQRAKPSAKAHLRKLFPGYVFCRFAYGASSASSGSQVVTTPGVIRIVGGRPPIPVANEELAAIQRALDSGLRSEPAPYSGPGQKVEVRKGPLRGLRGTILSSGADHRLVLSVELLQRSLAVAVDADWICTESYN